MKIYSKDKRILNAVIKLSKSNTVPDAKLVLLALDSIFEQSDDIEDDAETPTFQAG
ncbi:MAG: hypothetical protein PWP24_1926 [Clostridiales bacterium]|jgi:hypothetical protein|nr:hypothetical protein [Clostridiales bacterium]